MRRASCLGVLLLLVLALRVGAEPLRAGTARTDITPPLGSALWGYAVRRDLPSVGVRDPLHARAVVLEVGTRRLALVSLDLGRAPTRASMKTIRDRVRKEASVEHVFLVASHTHHGPVLEVEDWPKGQKPYVRTLEDKLATLITRAARTLQPARLGIATKEVALNRNRHTRRAEKPVDRELIVVRLEGTDGKVLAHLINFAAHPVMTPARLREFSADYPGVLTKAVEAKLGGVCLFLQGAAGDLSPNPPPGKSGPQEFGGVLANEVAALARGIRCTLTEPSGLKVRERDFVFRSRIDLGNPFIRAAYSMVFFKGLIDFYAREYREGVRPHLTTALLDGRIGLIGVSGEAFCEHALHLKRRARLDHLLFFGYCNDYHQYLPTIQAVAEGGYGADAEVSPIEVGAGERIMDRALIDLFEMRGRITPSERTPAK